MSNYSMASIIIGVVIGVVANLLTQIIIRRYRPVKSKVTQVLKRVFPIHIHISISFGGPLQ